LGEVDIADNRLITFDLDNGEPRPPSLVDFYIPIKIWNITIHQCIINEVASTCIMSKLVWKRLISPEVIPSVITRRTYDDRPSYPKGIFQNVHVELEGKTILIDIEFIDAQLDYNILFICSYMYAMNVITSYVFQAMMFPYNGKIFTIDQLTHYEPNHFPNIYNFLPLVYTSLDSFLVINMGPRNFKDLSLLGAYHGAPPLLHPFAKICVVSSNGTNLRDNTALTEAPPHIKVPSVKEILLEEFPDNPTAPLIPNPPPPSRGKS
jgi:hypothetical protein